MATRVAEKTQGAAPKAEPATDHQQVARVDAPRLPYHPLIQERFGIDVAGWRALVDAVFPAAKTAEGVILALSYCRARKLDPFKRMVHVVPVWDSSKGRMVEGVWPGIGEHRATAFRTGQYAGCDATVFGDDLTESFTGKVKKKEGWVEETATVTFPAWAQMTVYRLIGGQRVPFPGPRCYWKASYGRKGSSVVPNDKWQTMPSYMLEKIAEAAALRKAFPEELGDEPTAEEMEGRVIEGSGAKEIPPPRPERASQTAQQAVAPADPRAAGHEDPDAVYARTMNGTIDADYIDETEPTGGAAVEGAANPDAPAPAGGDGSPPRQSQPPAAPGGWHLPDLSPKMGRAECVVWTKRAVEIAAKFATEDECAAFRKRYAAVLAKLDETHPDLMQQVRAALGG